MPSTATAVAEKPIRIAFIAVVVSEPIAFMTNVGIPTR